ncbi:ATP-binding protein [Eubacterium sp. 1001713B170207_170306_E7]|uniref:sensor histidine kinase n=1 Tax=Eubacterium sp. 1001713B170207_170306_E7 TaxID=2787097 RepID=UPI00189B2824|nr:ATP-binding protein [Eubacterium sp. 1001713B170207_170306_E7]
MKKITSKWKTGLLLLYTLIILLAVSFLSSYSHTNAEKLFLTPTFWDNSGWDIYTMEDGKQKAASTQELFDSAEGTFYLTRTLDERLELEGYTTLELDTAWQESVFLDGKLLYTVDPTLDNRIGFVEFPKKTARIEGIGESVKVSLPSDYGGKTLTIALSYPGAKDYKGLPMVRLSSEAIQTLQLVTETNRIAMPVAVYMVAFLLLLGLFLYNLTQGEKSYSILLLMVAALIQSLRVLLNFDLYFSAHFSLNVIPSDLLIPLCVGLPMLYMLAQMKQWKKWDVWFLCIPFGLSILFHIAAKWEAFAFLGNYPYDALLYLSLLALMVFSILEYRDQNDFYRLFTPAFLIVLSAVFLLHTTLIFSQNAGILANIITNRYFFLQRTGEILLILGAGVSFLMTIEKTADTLSELSVMTVKNKLISENIQSIQKSSMEIAGMRHDMLRHLQTMMDLSHAGDYERMEAYLNELTRETKAIVPIRICEHSLINALVTRALLKAEKEGILMELHVNVPSRLSIPDHDLTTLLMNMLDNATEAAAVLSKDKTQKVELTMHVRGRYLFVETINPCKETLQMDKTSGLCLSTKGSGHGYGMKAMAAVAKKYNSILQIKQEQDTVIVRTALLLPQEQT